MLTTDILDQDLNELVSYEEYFEAFGYNLHDTIYFRTFKDKRADGEQDHGMNNQMFLDHINGIISTLKRRNKEDCGVFYVVNGGGNADKDVKVARAQFIDMDDYSFPEQLERLNSFPLEPSVIVKTQKSLHAYWLLDPGKSSLTEFRSLQIRLIQFFGSDKTIKNESRVMRLYGFEHRKKDPVMVTLIKFDPQLRYTQKQIHEVLPKSGAAATEEPELKALSDHRLTIPSFSSVEKISQIKSLRWLKDFFENHGINILAQNNNVSNGEYKGCVYIAVDCPWKSEHTEDTGVWQSHIIVYPNGAFAYKCYHAHCAERGWKEYRAFYEDTDESDGFNPFDPFVTDPIETLPDFPMDALPDVLRDFAEGVANQTQFPVDGVVMQIFGVLSLCLMGKYTYKVHDTYTEDGINLYVLTIAETGERKTTALKMVKKPFEEHIKKLNISRQPDIARSKARIKAAEKQIKILEKKMEKGEDLDQELQTFDYEDPIYKPIQDQYADALTELENAKKDAVKNIHPTMDDGTVEAIAVELSANGERLGILSDEGGLFQVLAGCYGDGKKQPVIDLILKAYSGEHYYSSRVTRGAVDLENPFLTINLSVQPLVVKEASANRSFLEKGLLARFLYCYPKSLVGTRLTDRAVMMPSEPQTKYAELITALYATKGGMLESDTETARIMKDFSDQVELKLREEYSSILGWANRLVSHAARIAAILHVVEYKSKAVFYPVPPDVVRNAIRIAEYLSAHALYTLNLDAFSDDANVKDAKEIFSKLCGMCAKRAERSFTKREVRRACRRFRTVDELQPGLDELVKHGYIRIEREHNKKGSPESEVIYINPEAIPEK